MNTHPGPLDASDVDRLIDGELNFEDTRLLLRLADENPTGWRQLALAFLEEQAWKRELSQFRNQVDADGEPEDFSDHPRPLVSTRPIVAPPIGAMAHSSPEHALVAQTRIAPGTSPGDRGGRPRALVRALGRLSGQIVLTILVAWSVFQFSQPQHRNAPDASAHGVVHSSRTAGPDRIPAGVTAGARGIALALDAENTPLLAETEIHRHWIDLPLNQETPDSEVISIPVLDPDLLDLPFANDKSVLLQADLLKELEKTGNRVHEQRRFYPVPLSDGRNVVIPVTEITVRPKPSEFH